MVSNKKSQYLILAKYKPHAGAGGAHSFLFLDLKTFLNFVRFQSSQDKYFRHPTIDLTWFCKKDLDWNCIIIFLSFLIIFTLFIVFVDDVAVQEDALKVEKSWFPCKILAPFFNKSILSFFFINQVLFLLRAKELYLFVILYSYTLSFALYLEWKFNFFFLITISYNQENLL